MYLFFGKTRNESFQNNLLNQFKKGKIWNSSSRVICACWKIFGLKSQIFWPESKYWSMVRKYLKKWLSIYLPLSWCEHRIVPCICGKKCKFEEPTVITHCSLVKSVSIKLYRTSFSPFSSEWELIFYPDWIALLKLGRHALYSYRRFLWKFWPVDNNGLHNTWM